ncbi:MAG: sigma-70 family RNA polymerase sigma factor [Colwellia sp.]|nr:sigma-70 family RNA polymerase sigma factor [Colwellia sp.]
MSAIVFGTFQSNTLHNDFWQQWDSHRHRLNGLCIKWLNGDQDKVNDALSTASEKALRYFHKELAPIKNFFAWIYRITYNICIDIHRFQARENELVNQVKVLPNEFYFSDNSSGLLEIEIEREYAMEALLKSISKLPEDLKQIIEYKFLQEMEYGDIAQLLNISAENVRKRVQLARNKLRFLAQS